MTTTAKMQMPTSLLVCKGANSKVTYQFDFLHSSESGEFYIYTTYSTTLLSH